MYVTTVTFTTAHNSITSVLNAIHLSLNSSIQKSHLCKKVAVNCARKIACFKKAVGYIGFRVTTSSVTHAKRPSAEEPDTAWICWRLSNYQQRDPTPNGPQQRSQTQRGYVGSWVTTSSVTYAKRPSAEEPNTVWCTTKDGQGSLGML
jgi:hypothetical protein